MGRTFTAYPEPITHVQPDGTPVTILGKGDEDFQWEQDVDGFVVLGTKQEVDQKFKYVYTALDKATNTLVPSAYEVGKANPRGVGVQAKDLPAASHRGLQQAENAQQQHGHSLNSRSK